MSSNGNQVFWNGRTVLAASILSIAASMGLASIWTTAHGDAKGPAPRPLATSISLSDSVERFDHSGIAPADTMEPDTKGVSIAAYGM